MSSKLHDALEAAHRAIDDAVHEAATTRAAAALERIAGALEKIEGHLSGIASAKSVEIPDYR
jgi:hypothetical protein